MCRPLCLKIFPSTQVATYKRVLYNLIYIAIARVRLLLVRTRSVSQNVHKELQIAQFSKIFCCSWSCTFHMGWFWNLWHVLGILLKAVNHTNIHSQITSPSPSPNMEFGRNVMENKVIPVQAWTDPWSSRSMRLPDFKIFSTWRW
jgi:hypothetical protein